MLGLIVITTSAGIIVDALEPFRLMFEKALNAQGVVPQTDIIGAAVIRDYGMEVSLIMLLGMITNIILAKFTKFKYIFLTGHLVMYMSTMIVIILMTGGMSGVQLIITGGITLGLMMILSPIMTRKAVKNVVGDDDIRLGHFSSIGFVIASKVGEITGDKSKSTENIEFPKGMGFLRDSSVAIAMIMLSVYITITLVVGTEYVESEISGGSNAIVFAITQSLTFSAACILIQSGVKMMLGEVVYAFKGISAKLVKNAQPALDCPVLFKYAPNAVVIGFICSFIGGITGMFILRAIGGVVIIPSVAAHFFLGASSGVFGNSTGGRRGAVTGAFTNGVLITTLPAALLPMLGEYSQLSAVYSDADYSFYGIILGTMNRFFTPMVISLIIIGIAVGLIIISQLESRKENALKEDNVIENI